MRAVVVPRLATVLYTPSPCHSGLCAYQGPPLLIPSNSTVGYTLLANEDLVSKSIN